MRLTVVGNSGSYPGPASPASCYLLEAEHDGRAFRVLLDLGSGALGALHTYVDPLTVDASCSATSTPTTASTSAAST